MKKLVIIVAVIVSLAVLAYVNTLDTSFGIKLPFGWAVESSPLAEGAQCIQGIEPYHRGMPFYAAVNDGTGNCGSPVSENMAAFVLNLLVALGVSAIIGYIVYRLLSARSER